MASRWESKRMISYWIQDVLVTEKIVGKVDMFDQDKDAVVPQQGPLQDACLRCKCCGEIISFSRSSGSDQNTTE